MFGMTPRCEEAFLKWAEGRDMDVVIRTVAQVTWADAWKAALETVATPDSCVDGFCPVELFRPIDDTEGSC